jgi:hypothetical protein
MNQHCFIASELLGLLGRQRRLIRDRISGWAARSDDQMTNGTLLPGIARPWKCATVTALAVA